MSYTVTVHEVDSTPVWEDDELLELEEEVVDSTEYRISGAADVVRMLVNHGLLFEVEISGRRLDARSEPFQRTSGMWNHHTARIVCGSDAQAIALVRAIEKTR